MRVSKFLIMACIFGAFVSALPCQLSTTRQLSCTSLRTFGQAVPQESRSDFALLVAANINDATEMKVSWRSPTGQKGELAREIMAGLVVALATIPTSISYSTIAGISPIVGIWNSALVGLVITIVGGAPGLIAGSAGVVALPMAKLIATVGLPYMSAALILSALLQALFGIFKLSYVQDLVTEPVIAGFMNALGIFLVRTQVKTFQDPAGAWLASSAMGYSMATAGLCLAIVKFLPMLRVSLPIPPSLMGLLVSSALAHALGWTVHIQTLADKVGQEHFLGGLSALPTFRGLPSVPLSQATLGIIGATAMGTAVICVIETILAMRIAGEKYRYKAPIYEKDDADRAVVGMGLGNFVAALFGGFGGCGLIPNTLLNGSSGGQGYASGFAYAFFIALAVVGGAPLLGMLPMAALAGLMLSVAVNTFEWHETLQAVKHARKDTQHALNLTALLATTLLCYKVDMGLGVAVGVLLAQWPLLMAKLVALYEDRSKVLPPY